MKKPVRTWIYYAVSFGIGCVISLAVLCSNSFWTLEGSVLYQVLSDAFLVSGSLLAGVGLLVFAANRGTFHMLSYAVIRIFDLFRPNARNEKYRDYYEYKKAKMDSKSRPVAYLLLVGLGFLALSVIFSVVWTQT